MRYMNDLFINIFERSPLWSRSVFSSAYGIMKDRKENSSLLKKYLFELIKTQNHSLDELEEMQNDALRNIIKHAFKNVEYYERLFVNYGINPNQIQTKDDLYKIPKLTKKIIVKEGASLLAKNIVKDKIRKEVTSGTTGTPLTIFMDDRNYLLSKAVIALQRKWAGYDERKNWIGILGGYKIVPLKQKKPPFWIKNYINRQIHFSTYHLNRKYTLYYIEEIKKSKLVYLSGYPSALGFLAKQVIEIGKKLPLRAVFVGSEPLLSWQNQAINKAFSCPIFNYYGQAERVICGINCRFSNKLHVIMEMGILQFEEQNALKKQLRMVGTSLLNYSMPLVRYELNDITSGYTNQCQCGISRLIINPVETKMEDYILSPNGTFIPASLLTFPFKEARGIFEAQIVQKSFDELIVRVVVNNIFTAYEEINLRKKIQQCIGEDIYIVVRKVDKIERTLNGKFRFVISEPSKSAMATDI